MTENKLSKIIVDISYKIHTKLGPGLHESVYEAILYHELIKKELEVEIKSVEKLSNSFKTITNLYKNNKLKIGVINQLQ
jgi:GxxExxY protein